MLYPWIKALHVVFVVAWFAGLFYLPRLFVYHAATEDEPGRARFVLMERRLFALMSLAALIAGSLGALLIVAEPAWLAAGWLKAKLVLVAGLVVYHIWCGALLSRFRDGRNLHSSGWYRAFNEVPTLFLLAIVILAVVKPF